MRSLAGRGHSWTGPTVRLRSDLDRTGGPGKEQALHSLHRGLYASYIHAGGLCFLLKFTNLDQLTFLLNFQHKKLKIVVNHLTESTSQNLKTRRLKTRGLYSLSMDSWTAKSVRSQILVR